MGEDIHVRTSDRDTVFFIRAANRGHSGRYGLSVRIEGMEDTAEMRLRIVGNWEGLGWTGRDWEGLGGTGMDWE